MTAPWSWMMRSIWPRFSTSRQPPARPERKNRWLFTDFSMKPDLASWSCRALKEENSTARRMRASSWVMPSLRATLPS